MATVQKPIESGEWVEHGPLSIRVERDPAELYVLGFYGEFDIAGVEIALSALRQAEESDAEQILVDLSGLDFIDSQGLRVLCEANRRERRTDRLVFLPGTGSVERVFALTQLDSQLPFAK